MLLIKTSVAYTIANFGSKGLNLLLTFFVIRFFEPNLFAEIDLLLSYVLYGALIMGFSIDASVSRLIHDSDTQKKKYVSNGFIFLHFIFIVLAISLLFFIQGNTLLSKYFIPFLILVYSYSLSNYISSLLRNLFRFKQFIYFLIIPSLLNLLTVISLYYLNIFSVKFYLNSIVFASLIGIILGLWFLKNEFVFNLNLKILKEILLYSFPIFLSAVLLQFIPVFQKYYIGLISISILAIYAFATKFMIIFQTLSQSIYSIIIPYSFKNFKNSNFKNNLESIFNISLLVFTSLLFLLVISLDLFIGVFFNDVYQESVRYMIILSIPIFLEICYLFISISFSLEKKPKYYLYNDIVYFIVFLIGLYFFADNSLTSVIIPAVLASFLKLLSTILFQMKKGNFLLNKISITSILLFLIYATTSFYFYKNIDEIIIKIYSTLFILTHLFINRHYLIYFKSYIFNRR